MGKIISIFNQKGGSAKSTTALNMSTVLAKSRKVLLIDNDGQANTTYIALDMDDDELEKRGHGTIHELLTDKTITANDVIYRSVFNNIDIIPSSIDHIYSDMKLITAIDNNRILSKKLKTLKNNYDYIIIDNPPAISLSTYNSLLCSDVVVAPIECSVFSAKGLRNLINLISDINENRDIDLKLITFLSKVDNRKRVKNIRVKNILEKTLGDSFIKSQHISLNSAYIDSLEDGETVITWRKDNVGKKEFENLTKLILDRMEGI